MRSAMWVLVGFVLVIATVNIALLLLTRGASREREFSIRLALGAGRGRVVRQLFVEGLTLGALGGVAGVAIAWIDTDGRQVRLHWTSVPAGARWRRALLVAEPPRGAAYAQVVIEARQLTGAVWLDDVAFGWRR